MPRRRALQAEPARPPRPLTNDGEAWFPDTGSSTASAAAVSAPGVPEPLLPPRTRRPANNVTEPPPAPVPASPSRPPGPPTALPPGPPGPPGPPTGARSKAAHGPPATLLTAQASDPSALSNALHSWQLHGTPLDSQRTFSSEGELTVALLQAVAEHAALASTASSSTKENEVP